jgi:peptide/nickel transport system substrate-binding protein
MMKATMPRAGAPIGSRRARFGLPRAPGYGLVALMKCALALPFFAMVLLAAATAAPGATLRIASSSWPPGYGNPYGSIAQAASHTRTAIYDGLVRVARRGGLEPALALRWEPLPPATWRFHLRPGVVFANGEPFDAATVKSVIAYLKQPTSQSLLMAAEVRGIADVRVVDDLTVDILTPRPDAVLPKRLSMIMMVPPKAWAERGPDGFTHAPIGSGAYVLKDWGLTSGKTIITANPSSWRKPAQIDRVELYPLKEQTGRLQALTSGRVDMTQGLGPEDVALLREQGYTVLVEPEPQVMTLALRNVGNAGAPLQDIRVRQAINTAVNKSAIAEIILRGTAEAVGQGAIAGVTGHNPAIKPYPYDPARARALLAEAGYGAGLKLVARIQLAAIPESTSVYQQVAADLAAVGIDLELRPILAQEWVRMYTSGDWGGADIISTTWNSAAYGDTIRAIETFSCRKPGVFFCAPEIEPLIDASNAELDPVKREAILRDIMARYHDLAPSIFLVNLTSVYAHGDRVKTVVLGRTGLAFEQMELSE